MGKSWNATMPLAKSSSAEPSTSRRLLSAKSTTRRIIYLLLHRVLQYERARHHLITRLQPGDHFLHVPRQHLSRDYFLSLEMPLAQGGIDPVAIVQVQDRRGRNRHVRLRLLAVESGRHEHPNLHQPRVLDFNTHFRRADIGIEHGQNIVDPPFENFLRIT